MSKNIEKEKNSNFKNNTYNKVIDNEDHYDVVLLQLPLWGAYHPPLAHGLLKSYLNHNGISCKTFDANAHIYKTRGKKHWDFWHVKHSQSEKLFIRKDMMEMYKVFRPLMLYYMNEIKKANPIVVGCSVFDSSRIITEIFFEDLRKHFPGYKHLLGGPGVAHFMKNNDRLINLEHIDAVCQDEGENALVDYVNAVKNDTGSPVAGMLYKREGKIIKGPPSMYKGKLDTLPFPDFDDCNIQHYEERVLPLYSSRGCVNKCNYCSAIGFMTNKRYPFRFRSGQRMFDEVVYLKNKYPPLETIRFANNIDNGKMKALNEFCDLMIESGLNKELSWSMESSVIRKEMRKPMYEKMKKAGCVFITYGVETPTEHLLEKVGKTLALQEGVDLPAILKEGKEAGIDLTINIMFGLPGETEEDFQHLLKFMEENKDALVMVNPAIQFCEYYPGSPGNAKPETIKGGGGVDMTKGTLMWETKDGKNNYLVRMDRFERLVKFLKKLKIDNFFQIDEVTDKPQRLFEYYYRSNDPKNAEIEYKKIIKSALTEQLKAQYIHITTGDHSALDAYHEKCKQNQLVKLEDYIKIRGSLEEDLINESLTNYINDFVDVKPYDREYPIATWKHNMRKVVLVLSGYNEIENLINKVLLSFEKIDKTLINAYNLEIDNKDKFVLIKKDVDNIILLADRFNKSANNSVSKFLKKINQTFYYHEKTGKFLNLFIEAFGIISNDKFGLQKDCSPKNLDPILKKLSELLNTIDENENKAFTNFSLENRIFSLYNRIVGYRHTSRQMAMLHSVIELIIKKMVCMKRKTVTLKIPEQTYTAGNLNSQDPSPIYAAKI